MSCPYEISSSCKVSELFPPAKFLDSFLKYHAVPDSQVFNTRYNRFLKMVDWRINGCFIPYTGKCCTAEEADERLYRYIRNKHPEPLREELEEIVRDSHDETSILSHLKKRCTKVMNSEKEKETREKLSKAFKYSEFKRKEKEEEYKRFNESAKYGCGGLS